MGDAFLPSGGRVAVLVHLRRPSDELIESVPLKSAPGSIGEQAVGVKLESAWLNLGSLDRIPAPH